MFAFGNMCMLFGESFVCIPWLQWPRRLEKTCFLVLDAMGSKAAGVRVHVRVQVQWIALHFERVCCNCACKWLSLNMCICFVVQLVMSVVSMLTT